jgi:hypothetical protein
MWQLDRQFNYENLKNTTSVRIPRTPIRKQQREEKSGISLNQHEKAGICVITLTAAQCWWA